METIKSIISFIESVGGYVSHHSSQGGIDGLLLDDDFSNSTKTASIGQAIPSAMGSIFELFAPISKKEFDNNIADLTPGEAIMYLEKKYVEIDYLYGSNVQVRESDILSWSLSLWIRKMGII